MNDAVQETLNAFISRLTPDDKVMVYIDTDGKFYIMGSWFFDIKRYSDETGYLVADIGAFNREYFIGFGVYNFERIKCRFHNNLTETEASLFRDVINYTFLDRQPYRFYPGVSNFKNVFMDDGYRCYALHDYKPYNRKEKPEYEEFLVRNLVFRTKDGKCPELAARLLALAACNTSEAFPPDPGNTVLIPIPASTSVAHEARFRVLCRELAARLGITDGYSLLELVADREPEDVRRGMPLSNVMRLVEYNSVEGKDVLLLDDVYTTGKSFRQVAQYLMSADARSITGLFVAKTMERPAKQESKLF